MKTFNIKTKNSNKMIKLKGKILISTLDKRCKKVISAQFRISFQSKRI